MDEELIAKRLNYPRVSEVTFPYTRFDYQNIGMEVLLHAIERGNKVHAYCAGIAKGLWAPPFDEECVSYMQSFESWFQGEVERVVRVEERLFEDELQYSGQCDLVVKLKSSEQNVLIGIKTSSQFSRNWPIQLAAYAHLLNVHQCPIAKALIVRLNKSGKPPKIWEVEDFTPPWEMFSMLLKAYDYYLRR